VSSVYLCGRDDSDTSKPVFVHMSLFQQKLLLRYGNKVCLIDATHNTTVYDMPLFMICVPTNSGYVVAASFLTTDCQAVSIEAGVRAIQTLCPDWKPQFVMSDYCEAQIAAVEAVFPGFLRVISLKV